MSCLVFDLGGTRMRAGLVGRGGEVLARAEAPTPHGPPSQVADGLCALAAGWQADAAGICAPGPLDARRGIMLAPPTFPGWANVPIADLLAQRLGLPVMAENDANAAAMGEYAFGAGRGAQSLVYVTVSTGIGGGIVVDGHLMRGHDGLAGEIGHMKIETGGPLCFCGQQGCFEALASGSALGARAGTTAERVVAAARAGDPGAAAHLDAHARALGRGFSNLLHLFAPDVLVMGGGISNAFDLLGPAMRDEISRLAMPAYRETPIVPAALGDAPGLVGMAHLIFEGEKVHG